MRVGIVKISPAAEMITIGNSFDRITLLAGPALMSDSISILNLSAFAETRRRLRPQPNNDLAPEEPNVYRYYCESQDLRSSGARCFRQWYARPSGVSLIWSEEESFIRRAARKIIRFLQQGSLPRFGSPSGAFVTIDLSETMFRPDRTTGRHFVAR